jgi:ferredoxin--NADP+ reductase
MQAVGQDVDASREYILSALPKAWPPVSDTRFRFVFLASPTQIIGNDRGQVCGLEIEDTTLVQSNGDTKARGLGTRRVLDIDMVVFCIGDRVDATFGLPIKGNEFVKNPTPHFPVDGLSYEAYDPQMGKPLEGVFVAGWSREASSGLVGVARKDGENGARAILQYLDKQPPLSDHQPVIEGLLKILAQMNQPVVKTADVRTLEAVEQAEALRLGQEEFKFKTNEDMLAALKQNNE